MLRPGVATTVVTLLRPDVATTVVSLLRPCVATMVVSLLRPCVNTEIAYQSAQAFWPGGPVKRWVCVPSARIKKIS
jgi:hypothetical protein